MLLFVPTGVDGARADRVPWVSVAIAALCVLAFALTWALPANPEGADDREFAAVVAYWKAHPYLELPPAFVRRYLDPRARPFVEESRREALARTGSLPEPAVQHRQQENLERLVRSLADASEHSPLRHFSLVPERGLLQAGWLTHPFLHFGWMHLLGNLVFFYLVAPLLERAWGRAFFAGFYVTGGLVAGFAHYLLDRASPAMMAGASGAIAACLGAFTLRHAARRVRIAYLLLVPWRRGTLDAPAWLGGALWLASEALALLRGGDAGVAVMAHLGGFAFGLLAAFALRASGREVASPPPTPGLAGLDLGTGGEV